MAESTNKNIRLGLLVLAGVALLISTLYVIGKNENIFGSHFELRARFANANGLVAGNNIRFSGIQAGTVKKITVIDDTTIEAALLVDNEMRPFIHKNAVTSIGTEGLIGNKVINIDPVTKPAPLASVGDLLPARSQVNTDEMLRTLNKTNENIAEISEALKETVRRVNSSTALWNVLSEGSLAPNLKASMWNVRQATANANLVVTDLQRLVEDVRGGKGSAGALLADTMFVHNLNVAVDRIRVAGERISQAGDQAGTLAQSANALIRDSTFVRNLDSSLANIRQGTAAFHEDMEALKHNFLLRGYFRRQEKAAAKTAEKTAEKAAEKNNQPSQN